LAGLLKLNWFAIIGMGDMVSVQLFGQERGSFILVLNRDGALNFPTLGPIQVGKLSFDEMHSMLQARVSQQVINVTVSITMGELRSIRIFILGEVHRLGSYMVSSLSTITNALFTGGGMKQLGSLRNIQLRRDGETFTTLDLHDLLLKGDTRADARLKPGDVIFIPQVGRQVAIRGEVRQPAMCGLKVVRLEGHVWRARSVQFRPGMRLTDLIPSIEELKDMPDLHHVLIRRELPPDRRVIGKSADLVEAWRDPGGPADLPLMARDQVRVFSIAAQRPDIGELLEQLRLQVSFDKPMPVVRVGGRVRAPGSYPLESGRRVSDVLPADGRLRKSAYAVAIVRANRNVTAEGSSRWFRT
jgi:protein involved in polysaccharide export with SLBB domain